MNTRIGSVAMMLLMAAATWATIRDGGDWMISAFFAVAAVLNCWCVFTDKKART